MVSLAFPGWWPVIGFLGILLDVIGAFLLAISGTDWFASYTNRLVTTDFTRPAEEAAEKLRENRALTSEDPYFQYLSSVFAPYTDEEIREFRYEETDVTLGDEVTILFDSGREETHLQAILTNIPEKFEEDWTRKIRDRVRLSFSILLLIGFFLQMLAYAHRYFIV